MGMLRSRKHAGKYRTNCDYGCCREFASKRDERRYIKRQENREWKREALRDL